MLITSVLGTPWLRSWLNTCSQMPDHLQSSFIKAPSLIQIRAPRALIWSPALKCECLFICLNYWLNVTAQSNWIQYFFFPVLKYGAPSPLGSGEVFRGSVWIHGATHCDNKHTEFWIQSFITWTKWLQTQRPQIWVDQSTISSLVSFHYLTYNRVVLWILAVSVSAKCDESIYQSNYGILYCIIL